MIYMILIGDNTLNVQENDMLFASQEDAESIANILLWKNKQFKGLPYCYINGLHNNLEYKNHEYFVNTNFDLNKYLFQLHHQLKVN